MKTVLIPLTFLLGLISGVSLAQAGLTGDYYNGTNFEEKVLTRIDPQLAFDWTGRSPVPGVGKSYYSIRWTGKLLAPVSGRYIFNAKVDDGIRIWVGNRKVMDVWRLNDSKQFTGSVTLEAGQYYDLRIDYFNDLLGGVLELFWQRPDEPKLPFSNGTPIGGQYLYQRVPPPPKPAVIPLKPTPEPVAKPVAVVKPEPKPLPKPVIVPAKPKPVLVAAVSPPSTPALPEKKSTPETVAPAETGKTMVLENVFFERSTCVLVPESFAALDNLVLLLRQHPTALIELAGHTDNVGDPRLNQTLSEYRARVVMSYLIQHGIAEDRITATGYGGSRPVTENNTEPGRAKNRRVEFILK